MNGGRRTIPAWWQATGPSAEPFRTSRSTPWSSSSTRCGSGDRARAPSSSRGPGLGRAIVAQRVGELLERGLVVEGDVGPSTGGRPPRQLSFRSSAGHLLVADLGATSIDVAMTTLDGRILAHRDEPASIEAGPEACLDRVEELFDQLLATTHGVPGRLWGIGIGVPGPVEFATGRPISPPIMPGWDGYPIRERFAARHGAPVWVDNDVNVLALGEWRSGVAAGHDDVVVVKIGTGIGAGIISGGRHPPRGAGQRRRRRPHPGHRGPGDHLPLRQHRLPRGAGRRRRAGASGRGRGARGAVRAAPDGARPARDGDGRGRRAGRVGRRPGRGRDAPGRRPARRGDARERRELLQPVADRPRRRRVEQPGRAARLDPRDRLSPVAAARDARAADPALVAGRAGRRDRRGVDGRRRALLARGDRDVARRPATRRSWPRRASLLSPRRRSGR